MNAPFRIPIKALEDSENGYWIFENTIWFSKSIVDKSGGPVSFLEKIKVISALVKKNIRFINTRVYDTGIVWIEIVVKPDLTTKLEEVIVQSLHIIKTRS